ncbi:MAG: hypothetical protein C0631_16940 [Sedimenticola sp.]|nr:MAG: hypothetical protein C0631_16940 [Sedimenticola sp.]
MDRFTRNYSIILGIIVIGILAVALYEDPLVSDLNDLLEQDAEISAYPYTFRVLRAKNGIATMSTPRSVEFPVQRALGILFPHLANRAQDDPDLMRAQDELARVQKHAQALITQSPEITRVNWALDKDWLRQHGVPVGLEN